MKSPITASSRLFRDASLPNSAAGKPSFEKYQVLPRSKSIRFAMPQRWSLYINIGLTSGIAVRHSETEG